MRTRYEARTAAGEPCLMLFDRTNEHAVRWARTQAARLVTQVSAQTRAAIRDIIGRAFEEGLPPRVSARLIRDVVGLRTDQARAVANLRRAIADAATRADAIGRAVRVRYGTNLSVRVPPGGLSADRVRRLTSRYAERLRRQRALLIARSETITASNRGQVELWRQARANGLLRGTERKRWTATPDDRTCPSCMALDGVEVALDEQFVSDYYGAVDGPTLHPACRCALVMARDEPNG